MNLLDVDRLTVTEWLTLCAGVDYADREGSDSGGF